MKVQQLIEQLRAINLPDAIAGQIEELLLMAGKTAQDNFEDEFNFRFLTELSGDVIWRLDKQFRYTYISDSILGQRGYTAEEFLKLTPEQIYPEDTLKSMLKGFEEARDFYNHGKPEGEIPHLKKVIQLRSKNQEVRWYIIHISGIWKDGEHVGFLGITHDIHERYMSRIKLETEREILNALLAQVNDTIYFKDTQSRFVLINKAQANILGIENPADAVGKTDFDFFDNEGAKQAFKDEQEIIRTGIPILDKIEVMQSPDGRQHWFSATKVANRNASDEIIGIIGVSRDITDRRKNELILAKNQQILSETQKIAKLGSWEYDFESKTILWSDETSRLFGFEPGYAPDIDSFYGILQPSDAQELERKMANTILTGEPYEIIIHELPKKSQFAFGLSRGQLIIDPLTGIRKLIGTFQDISERHYYESRLKESQRRLKLILDNLMECVISIDDKGTILTANAAVTQLFGYTEEKLLGKNITMLIPSVASGRLLDSEVPKYLAKIIPKIAGHTRETLGLHKNGHTFPVEIGITETENEGQRLYIGIIRDISSRKAAEHKLKQSEELLAQTSILAKTGGWQFDLQTKKAIFTDEVHKLFGIEADAITEAAHVIRNFEPEYQQLLITAFKDAIEQGRPWDLEMPFSDSNGQKRWIRTIGESDFENGKSTQLIGVLQDITDSKANEMAFKKTTTLQKAILDSSAYAIISTDLNGLIKSFNPAAEKMLGYSAGEVIGIKTPQLFHDEMDLRKKRNEDFKNYRIFGISEVSDPDNNTENGEFTFIRKDGSKFPVSLTVTAIRGDRNQVTGFLAMAENISQRKEQFDALNTANLRFRSLISNMQAGVLVEDENRNIVLVNQLFCDLFNVPIHPDQLIGMECVRTFEAAKSVFGNPEEALQDINHSLQLNEIVTDFQLELANGNSLERDFVPIRGEGEKNRGILWVYRDITKRKRTEAELVHQSYILKGTAGAMNYLLTESNYDEAIQKALGEIGRASDVDRAYVFVNHTDEKTGDIYSSQHYEWTAEGVSDQLDNPELQNVSYKESFPRWYKALVKGEIIAGLVNSFPESEQEVLRSQQIISMIIVPVFVKGSFWGFIGFDDCTDGIEWSSGEISILQALAASIGGLINRRQTEDKLTNAIQAAEAATQAKSEFLATMSHEIRTPMNGVIGMTSLLMKTQLSAEQQDYADTIKISGDALLNIINDILDFSKIESGKMELEEQNFDLRRVIEEVIDILSARVVEKKLELFYQLDPGIPSRIAGDSARLRQILINLVGNAIKFTENGEVIISVRKLVNQNTETLLEFSIRDTGIGIPADKIEKLFKPFSQVDASTTRKFGGTGLGLAISAKLVEIMQGEIWVESSGSEGSEFKFTIKSSNNCIKPKTKENYPGLPFAKNKRVLIVDSNQTNCSILRSLFLSWEMHPEVASTGEQALQLLNGQVIFDIVIVDRQLQDMTCSALVGEIKKQPVYSNMPLLSLAWPEDMSNASPGSDLFSANLAKPLKHSQLASYMVNLLINVPFDQKQKSKAPEVIQKISLKYPLDILVAEDNLINQKLINNLFEMLGYKVHIAANGLEAIEALNLNKFHIVFMDIQMPVMDGFEATGQIIKLWGDNRPLIIAMTANAMQSDREKCLSLGMDDYISKPLTIEQVKKLIEKWAMTILKPD